MKPNKNPIGMNLTVDEVQLHRQDPHPAPTSGAIGVAWEWVKAKPVETLLLSFLMMIFSGGCPGGNIPSDFSDLDDSGSSSYDYDYDDGGGSYQYDPAPSNSAPSNSIWDLTSVQSKLKGDAKEAGLMALLAGFGVVMILFIVVIAIILFFLGMVIRAWNTAYWLRLIRGQDEGLGPASRNIKPFIINMALSSFIVALGVIGGLIAFIIPAIILSLGWCLVTIVIVDKNLGAMDAIKASWRLTMGYKIDFLILFILFFLLNIVGVLACCVGVIVTNAIATGALAVVYDRIAEPGNAYLADNHSVANVFE